MKKLSKLGLFLLLTLSFPLFANDIETYTLNRDFNIRYLNDEVLNLAVTLPAGSKIEVDHTYAPVVHDYRDSKGRVKRSSNGFYPHIKVSFIPFNKAVTLDWIKRKFHDRDISLYISTTFKSFTDMESIPALEINRDVNQGYLKYFTEEGQPKFSFTEVFQERFGDRLNQSVDANKMDQRDFHRSLKVLEELQRVADRTVDTPASLLFINNQLAKDYSILFEDKEIVQPIGAWSIAVKGTAPRHGFGHVPCAEFMSEVLRQAYRRAGYKFTIDFNEESDNYLIWHRTAAVVRLADALFAAGWVPWELARYKPMIGAFMMHKHATTPGHAYMAAGLNGQFIMDNGSPLGRDLRVSDPETVRLLYRTGVFFLPPGINPEVW